MTEEFRTLSLNVFGGVDHTLDNPTAGGQEFDALTLNIFSGVDHTLEGPTGVEPVIGLRYLMRGIDTAGPLPSYHYWSVDDVPDPTGTLAGSLPFGGPLTDIVVAGTSGCV